MAFDHIRVACLYDGDEALQHGGLVHVAAGEDLDPTAQVRHGNRHDFISRARGIAEVIAGRGDTFDVDLHAVDLIRLHAHEVGLTRLHQVLLYRIGRTEVGRSRLGLAVAGLLSQPRGGLAARLPLRKGGERIERARASQRGGRLRRHGTAVKRRGGRHDKGLERLVVMGHGAAVADKDTHLIGAGRAGDPFNGDNALFVIGPEEDRVVLIHYDSR